MTLVLTKLPFLFIEVDHLDKHAASKVRDCRKTPCISFAPH